MTKQAKKPIVRLYSIKITEIKINQNSIKISLLKSRKIIGLIFILILSILPVSVSKAAEVFFVNDTFTDTAGDQIISQHTGETGATWSLKTGNPAAWTISNTGKAMQTAATLDIIMASGVPSSADYDVRCELDFLTVQGNVYCGGRLTATGENGYYAGYAPDTKVWELSRRGSFALLNTWPATVSTGVHTIIMKFRGTSITVEIDGIQRLSATDNTITAAGRAGILGYNSNATQTTGIHMASFSAGTGLLGPTPDPLDFLQWDRSNGPMLDLTGYQLAWSDEFDTRDIIAGNVSGTTKWYAGAQGGPYGAASVGYSPRTDVYLVSNGQLTIRAQANTDATGARTGTWFSGHLQTVNTMGQGFALSKGYFEARMKFPHSLGAWPSFWMKHRAKWTDPTVTNVELDAIEWYGGDWGGLHHTVHIGQGATRRFWGDYENMNPTDISAAWHTYGAMVDDNFITIYFDGNRIGRIPMVDQWRQEWYPQLTLSILQESNGQVSPQAISPMDLLVDYVRVYAPGGVSKPVTLNLEGRTNKTISGTIDVLNSSKVLIKSYPFTTDSAGATNVVFDSTPGTVYLKVRVTPYLARVITTNDLANFNVSFPQLKTGDINQDGIVNSLDYSVLNSRWFSADPTADLDKNGIVNSLDFSLINKNWFMLGET